MKLAKQYRSLIIPVDSEHSAIFQCLNGEAVSQAKKIILTASGGPFRNKTVEEIKNVTLEEALNHPKWKMGPKVTVDSASMMNKGFEVIEAKWLFGMSAEKIEVVVHPQSIVHSMVEFIDGSIKAQLGTTDMRLPIQYALSWPERISTHVCPISMTEIGRLDFEKPDMLKFPNLKLAFQAIALGGNASCVLNAANEIAVEAFLNKQIAFHNIPEINQSVLESVKFKKINNLDDIISSDNEARESALELLKNITI